MRRLKLTSNPPYETLGADEARGKLSSDFAKAAFDRLDTLGGQWRMATSPERGKVMLAPRIAVCHPDGSGKRNLQHGQEAETFDESVLKLEGELKKIVQGGDFTIVGLDAAENRTLSVYDAAENAYKPRAEPVLPAHPFDVLQEEALEPLGVALGPEPGDDGGEVARVLAVRAVHV